VVLEHRFDSIESLASALAFSVAADLARAIEHRGIASLMVSGGQTPAPFLSALAPQPIEWSKITVGLVDERWVAPDHVDSNERLVRQTLLTRHGAAATFVPMKNAAASATAGQPACERAIETISRPFDVVVLGMGNDGHIASLFPQTLQLAKGLDPTTPALTIATVPATAAHERMSLTLRGLLDSRRIVVLLSGLAKWQVYQRARQPGSPSELPVRAVLEQSTTPVDVYWCG
jgi:6-phosphogluconolactonase